MPDFVKTYVRIVEQIGYRVGRLALYLIFVMAGVLFYSSTAKAMGGATLWTLDTAQFLMVAYFVLGGAYSMQLDGHVRMDLIYGSWSKRRQAKTDTWTSLILISYLVILLIGSVNSTIYAIQYQEVAFSAWRPKMWPIKCIMTFGIFLILLQATAQMLRDWAAAKGDPLPRYTPEPLESQIP